MCDLKNNGSTCNSGNCTLVVQFWSEIILVISNRTRTVRLFDFEITRMISDQIALYSVQLPLYSILVDISLHSTDMSADMSTDGCLKYTCFYQSTLTRLSNDTRPTFYR